MVLAVPLLNNGFPVVPVELKEIVDEVEELTPVSRFGRSETREP